MNYAMPVHSQAPAPLPDSREQPGPVVRLHPPLTLSAPTWTVPEAIVSGLGVGSLAGIFLLVAVFALEVV